jgi:hypothetical protein
MGIEEIARGLSIERIVHLDRRRERLAFDALGEIEQQLQVTISGYAGSVMAWATADMTFDVEFLNAINQRYSNLTRPHFTYGVSIEAAYDPVLITAVVRSWTVDDREVISGCTLAIGACSPGTTEEIPYAGLLHATFQGYGAPAEYPSLDTQ